MSNPKTLPLRSGTSQALLASSSPISPSHKQKFRRYKSQHPGSASKQAPKRDLLINVGNAPSPFNSATKTVKNCLDLFSTVLDDFHHAKQPSMLSPRNDDASTRAGTLTCLSRNNLKSSQTPHSLTSLHSENFTPVLSLKDVKRSDGNVPNQKIQFQGSLLNIDEGFGVGNDARQSSVSLATEGSGIGALELMTEDNLTQRSLKKEEESKKNYFSIRKEDKVVAVTRSGKKTKKVFERTKSRKSKKENHEKSNEDFNKNFSHCDKEKPKQVDKEEKTPKTSAEMPKAESILEIKTVRANTITSIKERTQELMEMRKIHSSSQIEPLHERQNIEIRQLFKNEMDEEIDGKRNKSRVMESCCIELARGRPVNPSEEQFPEVLKQKQITRRPALRRMKSEFQTSKMPLERENFGKNLESVNEQTEKSPKELQERMMNTEKKIEDENGGNHQTCPRIALNEIEDQENQKEETNRKSRLEDKMKLKKKEDKEEGKMSWKGSRKNTQENWRQNIWDEPQEKTPDPKFELFKQTGNNFFELNLENKFLQKYGFIRTFEENAMNTDEQERIYTENLLEGTNTLESMRNEVLSRKILKTLPSEYSSKDSKSEKLLKVNPATMMVRYYDELNPLVIQPKFMASTGSMCVTELWGNKNKQDFYKTMRKPFQSNTIFSLNPQPGIYRPEKPSNNGDPNYKKLLSERIDKENESGAKSPSVKETLAFRSSRRARHTRAFVLQGTSDNVTKKSSYNRGYSSREVV